MVDADAHPRTKLELVESALAAWNKGGTEALNDLIAEDVVWVEVSGRPEGESSERVGRERLRQALESLFDAWETYRLDVERIEEAGDQVVAVVREVGRGRASGVEVDGRWGYLITVADARIARIEAYRDHTRALRAAGLSQ